MPPTRHLCAALLVAVLVSAAARPAAAVTPNGRLQIIHLDVGQGDGALLISPLGQVVMIDDGVNGNPTPASGVKVTAQLQALGVTHVDYHFTSHYHSDHIGLFGPIFGAGGIATVDYGWDRGGSYTTTYYTTYVNTIGANRRMMTKGQIVTLDSLSAHPVTIKCVDLNAPGVSTTDENTLSMVLKVSYGEYDEVFGGDLGGYNSGSYHDIETTVGPEVGPVEVLKVHHHGSSTSTNDNWLNAITPKLGIISCGNGNSYGHPTSAALTRLHNHGVHTYWTETGNGATPNATWDKVSNGQIVISATWQPAGVDTIRGTGFTDTFINSGTLSVDATPPVAHVTAPVGGEDWKAGSSHPVTWTATDDVGVTTVDLAYSTDGGATWGDLATGISNSGSYAWTVPTPGTVAGRMRVRAHDAAGNLGADSSASSFTVDFWTVAAAAGLGGSMSPSGTVNVVQGANQAFTIAPVAGCSVADVLADGGSVGPVTSYQFNAVTANHTLTASFLDYTAPAVALTSPVGGERWPQASSHDLTWSASDNVGVDSINVDVSYTGVGGPWQPVAHGLANTGTYAWLTPALDTDSALVRVTAFDHAHNTATAYSDSLFVIGDPTADVGFGGPSVLALSRPAPNPGSGAARLAFSLPHDGPARLEILDLSGRRVWHAEGAFAAGTHTWVWDGRGADGSGVGAGLYFVRLSTPWGARTERMVRLR